MLTRREFRLAIVKNLQQGLSAFDVTRLRKQYAVSEDDALKAARDVYFSQCLKATDDWTITDDERQVLRQLGERLELSEKDQNECVMAAKNRIFEAELKEAMEDEGISRAEANSLAHLRKCLGLASMATEEFGPPELRRKKRREGSSEKKPKVQDESWRAEWLGPWGPRSPILGIPYTILVVSFVGCGIGGAFIASATHDWWPVLASPGAALVIIGYSFLGSYCWHCGSTWCLSHAGSDTDYNFFGGATTYIYYECKSCGAVKTARRYRSRRQHRAPWDFWL